MWGSGVLRTAEKGGRWLRHRYREYNTGADGLATKCLTTKRDLSENVFTGIVPRTSENFLWLRGSFDGGERNQKAAGAWMLEIYDHRKSK